MARALKVFRTAAGFHDAYVAASSRKAALAAWGADVDLFARGIAEQVTDPASMAEPLEQPGEVIMRSRGGLADQLKALGPSKRAAAKPAHEKRKPTAKPPSRARLDRAEAALDKAVEQHAAKLAQLEAERDALDRRIDQFSARHNKGKVTLERRRNEARDDYRKALDKWAG